MKSLKTKEKKKYIENSQRKMKCRIKENDSNNYSCQKLYRTEDSGAMSLKC